MGPKPVSSLHGPVNAGSNPDDQPDPLQPRLMLRQCVAWGRPTVPVTDLLMPVLNHSISKVTGAYIMMYIACCAYIFKT